MAVNEPTHTQEGRVEAPGWAATVGQVAGSLGLTAAGFGLALYAIDPGVLPLALLNLGLGLAGLLLYALTHGGSLRRRVGGRSSLFLGLELLAGLGWLGLMGAVNMYAKQRPQEWDLTRDQLYSLHEQSAQVAAGLKTPVVVYGFFRPSAAERGLLSQAVDLYRQHSPQLSLRFINPDTAPAALVERFQLSSTSPRIVVEAEGGRFVKLRQASEQALTNALIDVSQRARRVIYLLQGHGEAGWDDAKSEEGLAQAVDALRSAGWQPQPLSGARPIPEDADLVISAGAARPLLPSEQAHLRNYLDDGGRVLALLEPGRDAGLQPLLAAYGIQADDDLVLEPSPSARAYGFGADAPIISRFQPHPITRPLMRAALLFYRARSLTPRLDAGEVQVTSLMTSGPDSWAERRYRSPEPADLERDAQDQPGPIPVAVAAQRRVPPGKRSDEARLVVIGDAHFAQNRFAAMSANTDLLLNAAHWLLGEEDGITIRPHPRHADRLSLTEAQRYGIMFFSVNLLPLLILGVGYSVWALRRRS